MKDSAVQLLNARGRMKLQGQDVPILLIAGNWEDVPG